jgi:hypothetical protein
MPSSSGASSEENGIVVVASVVALYVFTYRSVRRAREKGSER